MKLGFEVIGTLISVLILVPIMQRDAVFDGDAAGAIGYCIGALVGIASIWLMVEFVRRLWRALRRYDEVSL